MAFKATEWEYSKEEAEARVPIELGERFLYITNAYMTKDTMDKDVYNLEFEDLTNHAKLSLRYWLYTTEKNTNNIIPNQGNRNVLVGLGKALAGPQSHIGIPNPKDIIGGVVEGDIKLNKSGYHAIYEYRPVDQDIAVLADIDQYYIGQEFEVPLEDEAAE